MAYLVCSCTRFRPPRIWVQRLGVFAFLAGVFGRLGFVVQAEPISFQFEATISEVQEDVAALNLPFTLAVGQRIKGKYSFESQQDFLDIFLRHHLGKQGLIYLTIGGSEIVARTNFGTLNDGGPIDISNPPAGPNSSLSLGYSSPTDVIPGWGGLAGAAHPWNAGLVLVGPEGTISTPEDVLKVDTWNQLTTLRRLGLQFGYPNTVMVQTTVGDFRVVPEPSIAWLICAIGSVVCVTSREPYGLIDWKIATL